MRKTTKKIISAMLAAAMVFTSTGIYTLAASSDAAQEKISDEEFSEPQVFNLNNSNSVKYEDEYLQILANELDGMNGRKVLYDTHMPSGYYSVGITWESGNKTLLGDDGTVQKRPSETTEVIMTATLTSDSTGETMTKDVSFIVLPQSTLESIDDVTTENVTIYADVAMPAGKAYGDTDNNVIQTGEERGLLHFDLNEVMAAYPNQEIVGATLNVTRLATEEEDAYNMLALYPVINSSWYTEDNIDNTTKFSPYVYTDMSNRLVTAFNGTTGSKQMDAVRALDWIKADNTLDVALEGYNGDTIPIEGTQKDVEEQAKTAPYLVLTLAEESVTRADYLGSSDYSTVKTAVNEFAAYDGKSIINDIVFPEVSGVTCTITSSNEKVLTKDGEVVTQVAQDTPVILTATFKKGAVQMTQQISVIVLAVTGEADEYGLKLGENSRRRMYEYCKEVLTDYSSNLAASESVQEAGQRTQASYDEFKTEVEAANKMENGTYAANRMMQAGIRFIESAKIDNNAIEGEDEKPGSRNIGRKLIYSIYRSRLEGYVFRAESLLRIDSELYPQEAKNALQQQIDRAKRSLDGTFEIPIIANREFATYLDDQTIQYVTDTNRPTSACNFTGWSWGIVRAMEHYLESNTLRDAYINVDAKVQYATQISPDFSNLKSAMESISIGGADEDATYAYLQFDLNNVTATFREARLRVQGSAGAWYDLYVDEENPVWSDVTSDKIFDDSTPRFADANAGHFYLYGSSGSSPICYSYLTSAVGKVMDSEDKILTLAMGRMDGGASKTIAGTANSAVANRVGLELQLDIVDRAVLKSECEEILEKEKALVRGLNGYTEMSSDTVGQYSQETIDAVNAAIDELEGIYNDATISPIKIGAAVATLYSTVRDMRDSICMRTMVEDGATVFYGENEMDTFRETYASSQEYLDIKNDVDGNRMETVDKFYHALGMNGSVDEYNELLDNYPSYETVNLSVTPPAGTKQMEISIALDGRDNETLLNGAGHVWADNLIIQRTDDDGVIQYIQVPNGSFEEGTDKSKEDVSGLNRTVTNWTATTTGNGIAKVYNKNVYGNGYAHAGNYSIYMENPDENSSVTWTSKKFDITEDQCSVGWKAKLYVRNMQIFEYRGAQLSIKCYDEEGNLLLERGPAYTTYKSYTYPFTANPGVLMQEAAICYMVNQDKKYAEYAKKFMTIFLNEHLQGTFYWKIYAWRPNGGLDNYGSVQEGRNAAGIANAYSAIRNVEGLYSDEEREYLLDQLSVLLDHIMDVRDRMELRTEDEWWGDNWTMDEASGTSQLAIAFANELDYAIQYFDNGKRINQEQMVGGFRADGGWGEPIRYHVETIDKYCILAKAYRNSMAEDMFLDPSYNLAKALQFMMQEQTPPFVNGNIGYPPHGDDSMTDGNAFASCGLYYDEVYRTDPELGIKLYCTWVRAGRPIPSFWSCEENYMQMFFGGSIDLSEYDNKTAETLDLKSSDYTKYWGNFIMRNGFTTGKETYLSFENSERGLGGHAHMSQLSMMMYADNVPLVIDPGIVTYTNIWPWHGQEAHSMVQWGNGAWGVTKSKQVDWYTSDAMDFVAGKDGLWTRNIAFWKDGFEAFIVWDAMEEGAKNYQLNYALFTSKKWSDGGIVQDSSNKKKITVKGFSNVDLEMTFVKGDIDSCLKNENVLTIQAAGSYPTRTGSDVAMTDIIHVPYDKEGDDFLTILFPKTKARGSLDVKEVINANGITATELSHSSGTTIYVVTNNNASDTEVKVTSGSLTDSRTGTIYSNGTVDVPGGGIKVLKVTGSGNSSSSSNNSSSSGGGASVAIAGGVNVTEPENPEGQGEADSENLALVMSKNVRVGSKFTVGLSNLDKTAKVTYTSSNKKIATVSKKGIIKGKKAGKAVVTIVAEQNGLTYRYKLNITVKKTGTTADSGMSVARVANAKGGPELYMSKDVRVGKKARINFDGLGNAKVSYSSKNKKIATVNSKGVITGKKVGTTVITSSVKGDDGNTYRYRIEIHVKKKEK